MDLDALRRRLEEVLVQRGLGRPGPLGQLTGGWASTWVLSCDLSGRDDPSGGSQVPAVLKLYGADGAGIQHAAREHRALSFLSGTPCRVPAVLTVEPDPAVLGRPFLLMERVAGRSFWSAHESAADDDARRHLVSAFVRPLVALHALDARVLEPAAAQARGAGAADVELAGLVRDVSPFPRSGLGGVVAWLWERRGDLACERPVVQHRDYHPWNAVLRADGDVCVLDWDWQVGDLRFDVAWTRTLLARSGLDALGDAVRDEYVRQSGAPVEHLETFEVLTTVRWLLDVLPALGPDSQLDTSKREEFRSFLVEPLHRARTLLRARTGVDAPTAV